MNIKIKELIRNLSFSFTANIISMLISAILLILLPFFLSVENYGYWQLYIFYNSYIVFLSLGLTDGVYLRFGGKEYKELKKDVLVTQFWTLVLFDIFITALIAYIYINISIDSSKSYAMVFACIAGIIVIPRSLLTFILQATNRIKEFAIILILEKIIFFSIVLILLFSGVKDFKLLILADILGKLSSLILSITICRDMVIGRFASFNRSINEIKINISVGSKLLFSAFASMLIIGVVRLFIELNWSVEYFGKISLSLSISSMLMAFISAISIVLFPFLRRIDSEKLAPIYTQIRSVLTIALTGLLILFFPLTYILNIWLPEYRESLVYMALLFPIAIFDSKMNLLINTYLKTLRQEKILLNINLISVVLSILFSLITISLFKNLTMAVLSITIIILIRSIIAEIYIERLLDIKIRKEIFLEVIVSICFIAIAWFMDSGFGFFSYLLIYLVYVYMKRSDTYNIKNLFKYLN